MEKVNWATMAGLCAHASAGSAGNEEQFEASAGTRTLQCLDLSEKQVAVDSNGAERTVTGKSMRGLCKEEDYQFLGNSGNFCKEQTSASEEEKWAARREERIHRRTEREEKERERLRQLEESRKEKEEQWKSHVAELTSSQEKTLQQRLDRIRKFREFQRRVLLDEAEPEGESGQNQVDRIMTRI